MRFFFFDEKTCFCVAQSLRLFCKTHLTPLVNKKVMWLTCNLFAWYIALLQMNRMEILAYQERSSKFDLATLWIKNKYTALKSVRMFAYNFLL